MSLLDEEGLLDSLGLRHGTDKSSTHHGFLSLYERFLEEFRLQPIKMLEIGVHGGNSLRMWKDYFALGTIVGVDIEPSARDHAQDRALVEIADQSSILDLVRIARTHGPFDIVLDDGSHVWDHQIVTLQTMLPYVKPGGFYILEDLDTSYGNYVESYRGRSADSAARYLQRMSDQLVGDTALDLASEADPFIRAYSRRLLFVLFAKRTSIMRLRS